MTKPIGILGGTFDPIHHGHLRLALEAYYNLQLAEVRFLPLNNPAHRDQPFANSKQRTAMLKLAIDNVEGLVLDQRELKRDTISYTIDTLHSLRDEFPDTPLCLLMGFDAFAFLDSWKDWRNLLDYSHIIVASRHEGSSSQLNASISNLLNSYEATSIEELHNKNNGLIFNMQISLLNISSSDIRRRIVANEQPRYLVPDSVNHYIQQKKLYV